MRVETLVSTDASLSAEIVIAVMKKAMVWAWESMLAKHADESQAGLPVKFLIFGGCASRSKGSVSCSLPLAK